MKKLRRILSILLLIPAMLLLSACGSDPETPPPAAGGGSQRTETSLTISDSFVMGKDLVDGFDLLYGENDLLENNYLADVKNNANVLKTVSEVLGGYEELYWHYSIAVAVDDVNAQVNKLSKLYVDDMSTDEMLDVEVIMLFTYDGLDEEYSYKFYCFDVKVNKTTNEASIDCYFEDSMALGSSNSTATYKCFKITGTLGETKEISTLNYFKFERNTRIDAPSVSTVDNNSIKNFEGCKYSKSQQTKFYLVEQSDANMANHNSVQAETALEVVSKVQAERSQIGMAMKLIENASSVLVPVVNG